MRLVLFIFVIMGFLFYDNGLWVLLGVVCFSFVFGQCAWGGFCVLFVACNVDQGLNF